jgi:hypothetical protein
MRTISISVFALATSVLIPTNAAAQMKWTDKAYATITVGGQAGSHTLTTQPAFTLYEEPGTLTSVQKAGGGAFLDFGGGYKVWENLVLALSFSHAGGSNDVAIAAQVPDPVEFDRPRAATTTFSGASHSENAVHISALWMIPVTDKIEVGVLAGPTVFMVRQELATGITVNEPGPNVTGVGSTKVKKTTGGFDIGADVTYLLTKKIGAGLLARYTYGSVNLRDATKSLTVGGFQLGVGLRYRF